MHRRLRALTLGTILALVGTFAIASNASASETATGSISGAAAAPAASLSLTAECVLNSGMGGIRWFGPVKTPVLGSGEFVEVKTTISGPPGFRLTMPRQPSKVYGDQQFDTTTQAREFVPGTYTSTHTMTFNGTVLASTTTRVTCDFRPLFLDTDGPEGAWNHSAFSHEIQWMAKKGITTGFTVPGGREYRPFQPVARDAMAAFLYRFAGSPAFTPPTTSPFTDVSATHPFYREIAWLADAGISTGWRLDDGTREYRPAAPIARDAMAAFLYRFAEGWPPGSGDVPSFIDVPASSPFAQEIGWLVENRITFGWDLGDRREFRPYAPITRDAMAAFLYRYAQARGML